MELLIYIDSWFLVGYKFILFVALFGLSIKMKIYKRSVSTFTILLAVILSSYLGYMTFYGLSDLVMMSVIVFLILRASVKDDSDKLFETPRMRKKHNRRKTDEHFAKVFYKQSLGAKDARSAH